MCDAACIIKGDSLLSSRRRATDKKREQLEELLGQYIAIALVFVCRFLSTPSFFEVCNALPRYTRSVLGYFVAPPWRRQKLRLRCTQPSYGFRTFHGCLDCLRILNGLDRLYHHRRQPNDNRRIPLLLDGHGTLNREKGLNSFAGKLSF